MGNFIKDFRRSLSGASFESAEVSQVEVEPTHDKPLTQQDVDDVRSHRNEVREAVEELNDVTKDASDITTVTKAAQMVSQAAETAGKAGQSASVQSCVMFGNHAISDATNLLQTELPRLEVDANGVTAASMEGVMSWVADASKSVWNAAGRFFERVGISMSRLNKTSLGFHNRIARVQGKMQHRKGNGGKTISMGSTHRRLLVLGDGYATASTAGTAISEFSQISLGIVAELEAYMLKVDSAAKKELMGALLKGYDRGESVVDSSEYANKVAHLISSQPAHLLGNERYEFKETRNKSRILNCELVVGHPPAVELIKHLDPIKSLTHEEVGHVLSAVSQVVTHQTTQLQKIIKSTDAAFSQIRNVIHNLTEEKFTEDGYAGSDTHAADLHRLIRLENTLVDELGAIAQSMARHQNDLVQRIDAVLSLAEESVFQD